MKTIPKIIMEKKNQNTLDYIFIRKLIMRTSSIVSSPGEANLKKNSQGFDFGGVGDVGGFPLPPHFSL